MHVHTPVLVLQIVIIYRFGRCSSGVLGHSIFWRWCTPSLCLRNGKLVNGILSLADGFELIWYYWNLRKDTDPEHIHSLYRCHKTYWVPLALLFCTVFQHLQFLVSPNINYQMENYPWLLKGRWWKYFKTYSLEVTQFLTCSCGYNICGLFNFLVNDFSTPLILVERMVIVGGFAIATSLNVRQSNLNILSEMPIA